MVKCGGNKICHFLKLFGPVCYRKCMYRNVVASCYVCTLFFENIAELFFYNGIVTFIFFVLLPNFAKCVTGIHNQGELYVNVIHKSKYF